MASDSCMCNSVSYHILGCQVDLTKTYILCVLMPPLPIPPVLASIQSWSTLIDRLSKAILLLSIFVTVFRSVCLLVAHRKRRMSRSGMNREDSLVDRENTSNIKQRNDSSHEEELRIATDVEKEKIPTMNGGRNKVSLRPSLDQEPNQYLQSLKRETIYSSLIPIYPWIAPPQPLPGPYDAPYYPLPLPTIKSEESFDVKPNPPDVKLEDIADDIPEELESISYTRRFSTNSTPDHESLLEGSVTISTNGWKRTQWTVTAG
jgi:hypothetical protein